MVQRAWPWPVRWEGSVRTRVAHEHARTDTLALVGSCEPNRIRRDLPSAPSEAAQFSSRRRRLNREPRRTPACRRAPPGDCESCRESAPYGGWPASSEWVGDRPG